MANYLILPLFTMVLLTFGVGLIMLRSRFRAVRTHGVLVDDQVQLPLGTRELLGVQPGDKVHVIPFDV